MIELDHLETRAGAFRLRDLQLRIPGGEHGVLMGRTGCGKTTLLEAICGLRPVLGGRVLLNGRDVSHLPPAERGIGLVPVFCGPRSRHRPLLAVTNQRRDQIGAQLLDSVTRPLRL